METLRGTRGIGGTGSSHNPAVEEIVPCSGWTEDADAHYLLVDLPGFKKEEVKLQVDSSGHIKVSGERQVNDGKYIFFEQRFRLPENSDADNIAGKFDGEILYVTVPKQVVEEKRDSEVVEENVSGRAPENEHEKPTSDQNLNRDGHQQGNVQGSHRAEKKEHKGNPPISFSAETIKKWENESTVNLGNLLKMLKRNKGIVITALLAFSLGVLVSRKLDSAGH